MILPVLLLSSEFTRPSGICTAGTCRIRAASYACCQNTASSFRGTGLYFVTAVTETVVLGLFASTRVESTASRYYWLDRYVRHARYDSVSQLTLPI